jgi:hypothetical protein
VNTAYDPVRLDEARRMYAASREYFAGSSVLSEILCETGLSGTILRVLALEVALKCLSWLTANEGRFRHNYKEIWVHLDQELRERLIEDAKDRGGGTANLGDVEQLLDDWKNAFESGRYYYELSTGQTAEEVSLRGRKWTEAGASISEADFRFHPWELTLMVEAIHAEIDRQLNIR